SVIYHEQQIRDEQERQAQELARRWHEEQEPEARIWRGPSMGMCPGYPLKSSQFVARPTRMAPMLMYVH
ncbi:hypothetical protein, partial [Escherichia coli]|uniref:hypothetical protein n=1 Tax=Escherichia coli TaxID=562 RepID=UPI00201A8B60